MRMENPEALLDDLNEFTVRPPEEIPRPLENLLVHIAHTGDIVFPWSKLLPLIKLKLCSVLDQFHNSFPADEIAVIPNVPVFKYDVMRKRLIDYMDTFTSAPFTIQRICELITEPRRHYKRTDKFMRALEKTMLVVTTIEPHRNGGEGRRSPMMNGIVERSSSSSSSSPSSPQSTDSNEKTSSESDPEQMQPHAAAMLEGHEDFTSTSEEKSSVKSGNANEEYDESSSSLSVDLPDETDSVLADHLLNTQSILVSNSETTVSNAMQISTQSLLTETTASNTTNSSDVDILQSESSSIDVNANASTASVIKTWDDYSRTNVSSVDNVSSSDNPRVESPMEKAADDNNAATSSTDVSVNESSSYSNLGYAQHQDTSATSTYSATGANISQNSNDSMSTDMVRTDGDASSSSDKDSSTQDTIQTGEDSIATSDDKVIPDDGNVLMQEQAPDDGSAESIELPDNSVASADQTPGEVQHSDELTPDNEEHVDVMSMSEADATDDMQVSDESRLDEVQTTEDNSMGSEAETSDSSEAQATDEGAEAQALGNITSGDMQVVDNVTSGGEHTSNVTSAEVQGTDNVTSGETLATVSSGEMPISAGEAIENCLGSEAETTGGEDQRTNVSPAIQPSDNMYSEVQTTDSSRIVEAETSNNESLRGVAQTTDNMCSEAQSTDTTDQDDSTQFVDSPCSEVSGSDEQSSYLQGPEIFPTAEAEIIPDPVSQSDENVSNVTYKEDAGEASQSSSVSLQPPRPQEMEGEASQSSSVDLSPVATAADQTSYPTGSSLDEPSQSYHEDMEVEESHPNQKSPDNDVSSSETITTNADCNIDHQTLSTGVGDDDEDSMVVDVSDDKAESGGSKEADSTDNQQPMEET